MLLLAVFTTAASRAQDLPPATNVIARLLERSALMAKTGDDDKYLYDKRSLVEELDAAGKAVKTTEKLYKVTLIQGVPFSRLVKIQGRDLTPAELQTQDQKEQRFRKKLTARDPKEQVKHQEPMVTREITDRFDFTVVRREPWEGRPTLVLDFVPKAVQPAAKATPDQILSRLAGRLWVDEQDADLANLELHLTEPFSLGWLGMLGSLKQCDLNLRQQRTPEGVWVARKQTLLLVGRKLASAMRYRITDEGSGFHRP